MAQITYSWRSEALHGGWSDANNWWRGYTEAPAGNEYIRFDNNVQTSMTNNLSATSRFQLWFDSGASSARTVTGTSENVFYDYGGTAPKIENSSSAGHILGFPIRVGYNNFEINPVNGDLTLSALDLQAYNVLVYGNNAKTLTVRGPLKGSTGGLTIHQNSTVILQGSPTNSGAMTVNAGVLQYNVNTGTRHTNTILLGATSGSDSARLQIGAANVTVSNLVTVRSGSGGTKTMANLSGGPARFHGLVTLNDNLVVSNGAGGSLVFGLMNLGGAQRMLTIPTGHTGLLQGAISNDGGNGLIVRGGGELQMGALNTIASLYIDHGVVGWTNTAAKVQGIIDLGPASGSGDAGFYVTTANSVVSNQLRSRATSGGRTIQSRNTTGTVTLSGTNILDAASTVYSNAAGGVMLLSNQLTGTGQVVKVGEGDLRLSASNNFSGTMLVSNGTLNIRHAYALGRTAEGTEVRSGAQLTLQSSGGTTYADEPLRLAGTGATSTGGVLQALSVSGGNATWPGNITLTGDALISSAVTLTFTNAAGQTLGGAGNYAMRFSGFDGVNDIIVMGARITNAAAVIAENNVELRLHNLNNSYDAATIASNASINIMGSGSLGVIPGSPAPGRLRLDSGRLTWSGASGSIEPNIGIELVNYGVLRNASSTFTYGGVITGAGLLIKEGGQMLVLTNDNTFTGGTVITGGTIRASLETSFGPNPAAYDADNIVLDGGGIQIDAGQTLELDDANRGIETRKPGSVFNVNSGSATMVVAVAISGTGGVSKTGAGLLVISGANNYSGTTAVAAGTLAYNGTNTSTAVGTAAGATLIGSGSIGSLSVTGRFSAGGAMGLAGQLRATAASFEPNGTNIVDITSASGTPGVDWDVLTVDGGSGTLAVNSTSGGGEFVVALTGNPAGFNNTLSYTWTVVDAGNLASFSADKFILQPAGFVPALGGGTLSLGESGGDLVISFTPAAGPEIAVFGNNLEVSNGASSPGLADHTDFGDVAVNGGLLTRTYTITNQGASSLTLGNATTSGVHAAEFVVTTQPAGSVAAGGTTTLDVRFDPAMVGTRSAILNFSNNDTDENPFTFTVQGTGTWAGIAVTPASLSVTAMVGDSLSGGGFGVTNVGNGTLSYSISTNQSWLSVSPVSGNLTSGAGQQHTVSYHVSGWSAGVSNATITVSDAAASNNPQVVHVSVTFTNIPSPAAVAGSEGAELVRLGWSADRMVLIVHRAGASPAAEPVNGTAYGLGDPLGGGAVIYAGPGLGALDHVVSPATEQHYAFYAVHHDYYSPSVAHVVTTVAYAAGAIVEPFAYTQTVSMAGLSGGTGFTNGWTVNAGTWTVRTNAATPDLDAASSYPSRAGNKIEMADPGNGGDADAQRAFAPITSGKLYVSYLMSYQYNGANKYAGLALLSNGTERAFVGEIYGQNQQLGIASYGGADVGSSFLLAPYAGGGGDTGNVYAVVLRYDFTTRQLDAKVFRSGTEIPAVEPASWDAGATLAAGRMDWVNGIRLAAGAGSAGDGTVGNVYWDELRVATNWTGLLDLTGPILDVYPATLVFTANLGQSPAAQTFGISNVNAGTMIFSNSIAYGSGASAWLTLAPGTGSLGAVTGQSVTAAVAAATLPRGVYTATGTVYAVAAGTRAVSVTLSVTGYNGQVAYDTFDYTSWDYVEGKNGGSGWTGSWNDNAANTPNPVIGSGSLAVFDNYCNDGGQVAFVDMADCGGGGEDACPGLYREVYRGFPAVTSGVIYLGFKLKAQYTGSGKDYGVMLGDDGSEKLKVGKVDASSDNLGLQTSDGASTSGYGIGGADSEYLILARYDFVSREFKVKGYYGNTLGTSEVWEATTRTAPAGSVTRLNRVTLYARNGLAGETAGAIRWDDVRIATTWSDLLCGLGYPQDYPVATNRTFGSTFTDAQIAATNLLPALEFFSAQGVRSDSSIAPFFEPNFDLYNSSGDAWLSNQPFSLFTYTDLGRNLQATTTSYTVEMTPNSIGLGTNYLRWSAISSNQGYRTDQALLANGSNLAFMVIDDDVAGPVATLLYVGTNYTPGAVSTQVTDGDLADGGVIDIAVLWSDPSGVWLTNDINDANVISDTGNVWPNWDLTNSLNQDFGLDAVFTNWIGTQGATEVTNIAYDIAPVDPGDITIDTLWTISVSAQDMDLDRGRVAIGSHTVSVDRAITTNQALTFSVVDDDAEGPHFRLWSVEGGEEIGYTNLSRGDIAIVQYYNLTDTYGKEQMHFISWKAMGVGTTLKLTDWGWTTAGGGSFTSWPANTFSGGNLDNADFSNSFVGARTEKNLNWVGYMPAVVTEMRPSGVVFSNNFLFPSTWRGWWAGINPGGGGDQLFVFQGDWSDINNIELLYGLANGRRSTLFTNGFWYADATNHMSSALPPVLTNELTAMSFNFGNGTYTGKTVFFNREDMLAHVSNWRNWTGHNLVNNFASLPVRTNRFELWNTETRFQVTDERLGAGISISGVVFDTYSGIHGLSAGPHAPTLTLFTATGSVVWGDKMNVGPAANGLARGLDNQHNLGRTGIALAPADIYLQTYTARVSVTDYDVDRSGDMLARDYDLPIVVVDDDVSPPKFLSLVFDVLDSSHQTETLDRGDIAFVEYFAEASGAPALAKSFAFALLVDIAEGVVVNFADQGWRADTGNWQSNGEGHIAWTAPPGGLIAGSVVYITNGVALSASVGSVSSSSGTFDLNTVGDQILAYTGTKAAPFFIAAINASDDNIWSPAPVTVGRTSLPPGLTNDVTANLMGNREDGIYFRSLRKSTKEVHLRQINDAFSWHLGDDRQFVYSTTYDIQVIPSGIFYNAGEVPEGRIDGYVINGLIQDEGSGLFGPGSSHAPTLKIYDPSGLLVVSTNFDVGPAFNGDGKDFPVAISVSNVLVDLQFGNTYTAIVMIADYDVDRAEQDWLETTQVVTMAIIDDDTNAPIAGTLDMYIKKGATWSNSFVHGTGSNRFFEVSDGDLRTLSTETQLLFSLNISDADSGIPRGWVGPETNLNVSVPGWFTNNLTNYSADFSSADTRSTSASNVWRMYEPLGYGQVTDLYGVTNPVAATLPFDDDNDRLFDRLPGFTNRQFGLWRVSDDDPDPPTPALISYGGSPDADRYFWVATNGAALEGDVRGLSRNDGAGSNVVWTLTDAEMMTPSSRQLRFAFGAMDEHSGIARGTAGTTNTKMNFSISTVRPGDFTNYDAAASGVDGWGHALTNVWTFGDGAFTDDQVNQLVDAGAQSVYITLPDTDDDRSQDVAVAHGVHAGWLRVEDDDVAARPVSNLTYNGQTAANLATSFDHEDGWTNYGGFGTYSHTAHDGLWTLNDMGVDGSDDRSTTVSRGMKVSFHATGSFLQPPPVTDPGALLAWMRNDDGAGTNYFTLEYWPPGGASWINPGITNTVSGTNYTLYSFPVDYVGGAVTLRLHAVSLSSSAVFMDDLAVTRHLPWTNAATAILAWQNPGGEASGIYQYRYTNSAVLAPTSVVQGAIAATNSAVFVQDAEGIITGYVYMVDNDNDRSNDRTKGMSVPYRPRIDLTPPPRVSAITATNGPDEATEIRLDWTPLANAGNRSDGESLSPWHTYTVYYEECESCPVTTNSPSITFTNGPSDLATNTTSSGIFSNFNFDSNYRLSMAGSDRAGNHGVLSDTVDIQTVNFIVTQGLTKVSTPAATSNQVEVSWLAAEAKVYDVLYTDTPSFSDALSNSWKLMSTVTNSWMLDNGGMSPEGLWRTGPALNQHTMRFYRVAREGTWRTNHLVRRASREVYAAKAIRLNPGENWISTFSIPDTSTVSYVLGTNRLVGGTSVADSPKVTFFQSGNVGSNLNGEATNVMYLTSGGNWVYALGGVGSANHQTIPLHQGFLLELPTNAAPVDLVLIGRVPTNQAVQELAGGSRASPRYHVLGVPFPQRTPIEEAGIAGSGFVANNNGSMADEVRILNNRHGRGSLESPKARLYRRTNNTWNYYITPTNTDYYIDGQIPTANNFIIEPDDAVVIIRRNAGTMYWTNRFSYSLPGKNMNP